MFGKYLALATLVLFVVGAIARFGPRPEPTLRRKPGESEQKARLILAATYRIYSWVVVLSLGFSALQFTDGSQVSSFMVWHAGLTLGLALVLAHAIYWRLNYGSRRWWLLLGHFSPLFALTEVFWGLREEVHPFLPSVMAHQGSQPS